jgi:WD40 repeat protein
MRSRFARHTVQRVNTETSAFISYSRKDREFVVRLHAALMARGKTGWVDWEGIPPSAAWLEEIHAAIDAAQAFLFVLSPDSVKSQVCGDEIAYAQARGKRLIPIIYRDVAEGVPDGLARLNWVLLRPEDDFDRGVDALVKAIDTDLDWVRLHTRLLVGAQRWSEQARDRSTLLRGRELKQAEDWLFGVQEDSNAVTQLHRDYIRASREFAQRTLRAILATTAGAFVVMSVLAVLAWTERNTARSREIAAVARERLADEPELAALLAREALASSETPQADVVLRLATLELRRHRWVVEGVHLVESMDFIDGGARLRVTALRESSTWDMATGKLVRREPVAEVQAPQQASGLPRKAGRDAETSPCKSSANADSPPVSYAPNRASFVVANDEVVSLWSVASCRPVMAFRGHTSIVYSVDFSPDGTRLLTGSNDNTARMWDVATGRTIAVLRGHTGAVKRALFDPLGQRVATVSDDYSIRIWRADTGELLNRLRGHREGAKDIRFSPDGQQLASVGSDGTLRLWSVSIPHFERVLLGHQDFVHSVSFSPDSHRLLTTSSDKTARIWDVQTGSAIATLGGHADFLGASIFSPNGSVVATGGRERRVRLWNATDGTLRGELASRGLDPNRFGDGALAFNGDGSKVLALWDRNTLQIWDVATLRLLHERPGAEGQVYGVDQSADRARLVVANGGTSGMDSTLRIFDVSDGRELLNVLPPGKFIMPQHPRFNPDGSLIALTEGYRGLVHLHSASTGARVRTLTGHSDKVDDLAFSPDGQYLLSTSRDGTSRLWSVANGSEKARLEEDANTGRGAVFHPEGHVIVTFDEMGTARAWRTSDGGLIRVVGETRFPGIRDAAFSKDGQWLGIASSDRTARLYPAEAFLPIDSVQSLLQKRLSRDLTEDERRIYLRELIPRMRAWWRGLIEINIGT